MNDSDLEEFSKCLLGIGELYDKSMAGQLIDTYWSVLKNFPIEEVKSAFEKHISNPDGGQFFPKPADIIRGIQGGVDGRALQAWSKVDKAIRSIGPYEDVVFDDPLIHSIISDMGGWVSLNKVTDKEYPFKRNEFATRYRSLLNNPPINYPSKLIGIATAGNSTALIPVMLGDQDKCKAVYSLGIEGPSIQISRGQERTESLELPSPEGNKP